ncbi:LuxR C-terminal-related transcriptional regulator [Sphingobacterium micropteri]|uniref:LuxR C-terminal-related transcriptional regulator n=1 Tax=Sphingobacterium micropteri TaxID=2763501 RepID=UPI001CC2FB59|nr:helix-turn-helix domain-containing protein [Sphingobacterium micropteri]
MDLKQIITLHLDGASNRKIGSTLGISRNTVNTYMQLFSASDYSLCIFRTILHHHSAPKYTSDSAAKYTTLV